MKISLCFALIFILHVTQINCLTFGPSGIFLEDEAVRDVAKISEMLSAIEKRAEKLQRKIAVIHDMKNEVKTRRNLKPKKGKENDVEIPDKEEDMDLKNVRRR
ncbi:uncharacterized protein LOC130655939 [Hydractinia symbiolongicarpus]|uniref:uncharacterized protein LOC130655939 n=1 Tax=Hydractinia symbiolongicarpus TaxID=13093 RepID=UPI00254E1AA9|nr:uncharacterized protein LOC130655939 [Hydractinia symbiolongicarpus]